MSITKRISIVCLLTFAVYAQERSPLVVYGVDQSNNEQIIHNNRNFYIASRDSIKKIQPAYLDPQLRSITSDKLQKFGAHGFLTMHKLSNGEYALKAHVRGLGGGVGGAYYGFWGAKFATHLVAQTVMFSCAAASNFVVPGSGMVVYAAMNQVITPVAEMTSNAVGLAGGIALAVATGPA